jgi:hypothetical protein
VEQLRDERLDHESRRAQADQVSAWLGERWAGSSEQRTTAGPAIWVRNVSMQPIYKLTVSVVVGDSSIELEESPLVGPQSDEVFNVSEEIHEAALNAWASGEPSGAVIRFRDASGRTWTRHVDGQLEEHEQPGR